MSTTRTALRLTYEGAQVLLAAAIDHAATMGILQCIAVVDDVSDADRRHDRPLT